MITIYDKITECCGCEACAQICPKHCISMLEDEKGFVYPKIDQTFCIDCGMCRDTCLYHNQIIKYKNDNCFIYLNKDTEYRLESSSSGAFEAICRAFTKGIKESDIIIFGCELSDNFISRHSYSVGYSDLGKFKKSKYIQSKIGDSFTKVKKFLKEGKTVVFSGTPCQIQGLKMFLKSDYPNLLLIDIICHGVPSQKVFSKYLETLCKQYKSDVCRYQFRVKMQNNNGDWSNSNVKIKLKNNRTLILNCTEDMYMSSYYAGLFNRSACEECRFASVARVSDITIGDFWGIGHTIAEYSELITNGTSLLLLNTEKGKALRNALTENAVVKELPLSSALPYNGQLSHPSQLNDKSELFFSKINQRNGFMIAMRACYPMRYSRKSVIKNKIYNNQAYKTLSAIKESFKTHFKL